MGVGLGVNRKETPNPHPNWLITETTRFNAALSGACAIEQVSCWGMTDLPILPDNILGGFPWVTLQIYQGESAIYQLDMIRTPTPFPFFFEINRVTS